MAKFNVGDEVKVVRVGHGYASVSVGKHVTVVEVGEYNSGAGYRVTPEDGGNSATGIYNGFNGEKSYQLIKAAAPALYGVALPKLERSIELVDLINDHTIQQCDNEDSGGVVDRCDGVDCGKCVFLDAHRSYRTRDVEEQKKMLHDLILTGDIIV